MSKFEKLRQELPHSFSRRDIPRFFGGALHVRTLANLESQGKGPKKYTSGRKVIYLRDEFLEWLAGYWGIDEAA